MSETKAAPSGWRKRAARTLWQIGPLRLAGTALLLALALVLARYSWDVPLASDAERGLYDLRLLQTADRTVEQDGRIVLVTYNDETLERLRKRSPLDRAMLARALRALDGMGPRAIGIDILLDQPQDEDPELIATLNRLRTPTFLAFGTMAATPDHINDRQEAFLRQLMAQVSRGPARPANIRLETDKADGVIRRWPTQDEALPPFLANRMAAVNPQFRDFSGAIDFRFPASVEVPRFANLPIQLIADLDDPALDAETRAAMAAGFTELVRGRHILIGGDISDQDDFETPLSRFTARTMKGIEVHAHMLSQQLDGRMPVALPPFTLWVAALAVIIAGGMTSVLDIHGWRLMLVMAVQVALIAGLPFLLQASGSDTLTLPAFGWGAGWFLAFAAVGTAVRAVSAEQRRFAQGALGKYLPVDVAQQILADPDLLALRGEKREIYALFTDMEGFTELSTRIPPEALSEFFNRYLDAMSDVVLAHGGTIDKFVGDAVVAFWGAPIARPDDADRAVQAAVRMFEVGQTFRVPPAPGVPPVGCTRVGLHRGEVVVGNFGGEGRIQYTALGDGMNTAARLEGANKYTKTTALVSSAVKERSSLGIFRPMGRIVLSGRASPVEVWEPMPDMDASLRQRLTELWHAFDGGDEAALGELETIAAAHPDDAALEQFVYRLRECGSGGCYVLGSK